MLEFEKLLLFFEIIDYLLEGLLEHHNLFLETLNFLCLIQSSLFVLLLRAILDDNVATHFFLIAFKSVLLSFIILKSVSLTHSFFSQLLILVMDASLNVLDVSLGVLLGFNFMISQLALMFSLHFLFHSGLFDFNSVFLFLDGFLETCAILSPGHELQLIFEFLPLGATHLLKLVRQFGLLDHGVADLLLRIGLYALHLALVVLDGLSLLLLIGTLKRLNLALEQDHLLHSLIIILGELQNDILLLLEVLLVLGLQITDILCNFSNLAILLLYHLDHKVQITTTKTKMNHKFIIANKIFCYTYPHLISDLESIPPLGAILS